MELIKILIILAVALGIKYVEYRRKKRTEAILKQTKQTVITNINRNDSAPIPVSVLGSDDPYDFQGGDSITHPQRDVMNYETIEENRELEYQIQEILGTTNTRSNIMHNTDLYDNPLRINQSGYNSQTVFNHSNPEETPRKESPLNMDATALNIADVDWRKALIYSEILKPKF